MNGSYDVHTNAIHYPQIMQPTHVRYERVPPPDPRSTSELMNNMSSLTIGNQGSTTASGVDPTLQAGQDGDDKPAASDEVSEEPPANIFPPVSAAVLNKYVVEDIVYESPPYSNMGLPGPDGDLRSLGPNGLVSIANPRHAEFMNPEIIALLPDDCKEALIDAAANEAAWKSRWSTESDNCARSRPLKSYAWYP